MEQHNQHLERMTQNLRRDMLLDQLNEKRPSRLARWMERNESLWIPMALVIAILVYLAGIAR